MSREEKVKALDYKILAELLRNSRISDRRLAKILGVSQPTVTRRRTNLEKTLIDAYTVIPKWEETDFKLAALTFVVARKDLRRPGRLEQALEKVQQWLAKHPSVILASRGEGLGFDGVMVSFHRSYTDFMQFKREHDMDLADLIIESRSFLVDISPKSTLKRFHLKYLADLM